MSTRRTGLLNMLSYLAVVGVGIALLLSWLLNTVGVTAQVVSALNILAQALAYLVVACYSFNYARIRGTWWLVVWAFALALIVIFLILGNISFR